MIRAIRIALCALILTATGAILFLAVDAHRLLVNADGGVTESRAVLRRVNGPTGPITETDKLLLALKSTTVHADMVIAHEDHNLAAYDRNLHSLVVRGADISGRIADLVGAATDTAHSASATLQTANRTIEDFQPLLASLNATAQASTRTIDSVDARIRDPRLDAIMQHIEGVSASADGIVGDGRKVADKVTTDYLKPVPWWKWPLQRGGELMDIGSAVARQMP